MPTRRRQAWTEVGDQRAGSEGWTALSAGAGNAGTK